MRIGPNGLEQRVVVGRACRRPEVGGKRRRAEKRLEGVPQLARVGHWVSRPAG